jgi:AcrR family transcriptional regulator
MKPISELVPGATFRDRLLAALAQSIREKGLRRTQITDIVRIARTSRRTFYECFADKESCFIEMIESARDSVQTEILDSIDPAKPWAAQVDQAVDAFLGALAGDPALTVTISRELPALGPRGFVFQREGIELYAQLVVELSQSESAQREGIVPFSLDTAVMLVGGIGELVDRAGFRDQAVESLAPVIKAVVKAVAASPRTELSAAPKRRGRAKASAAGAGASSQRSIRRTAAR